MFNISRVGAGLFACASVCACSSSYEPAKSPRITTVVESGSPTFVKDGERYGTPLFSAGLVRAVQGNPRAVEQARIGRNFAIGGFVVTIAGAASEVGGLVALAHQGDGGSSAPLATGLVLGGIGAVIAGGVMLMVAQPHISDSVNIYNDGVGTSPR